jgi:DNA-binding GntR family transcriptional regulator
MQESLAEKAYHYIASRLIMGHWPPGRRLVTRALAREIGVSAIPLREAIQRLVVEGLLTHVSGAGTFVPRLEPSDFIELCGLREALESYAAAEAAEHATRRELVTLEEVCREFRWIAREIAQSGLPHAAEPHWLRTLELEDHFHVTLMAAAHNRWLFKVATETRLLTRVFGRFRDHAEVLTPKAAQDNADKHQRILDVLGRHDAEEARGMMVEHIRGNSDILLRIFARRQLGHGESTCEATDGSAPSVLNRQAKPSGDGSSRRKTERRHPTRR